ncbi:MAG: methionyl-tRNA formyltransferase [Chloroflexi bacterium]|nr:methionyl-tRNA formyltransferase [Chloroflexota bacterium]
MIRIVFAGTRGLALPVLEMLLSAGSVAELQVVAVLTQPDRPAGRSSVPVSPPVKELAVAHHIPVLQPESLRTEGSVAALQSLALDAGVVASYAQLLPRRVLRIPTRGWLNIHPSLLPRYRGPSPIATAILEGDDTTGVSIIKLVREMDAGPIVDQVTIPMPDDATTAELLPLLGRMGAERLLATLPGWIAGSIKAQPQDEALATSTRLLSREDALLDWTQPAPRLARQVRAFDPWPGTFTWLGLRRLSILEAHAITVTVQDPPGTILQVDHRARPPRLVVACGTGALVVTRIQLEGRKAMGVDEFARGQRDLTGRQLAATPLPRT